MTQNCALELTQRGARLEPELLVEHPARLSVGLERVSLPPAAIQGEDQLPAQTLSQRM